MKNGSMKQIAWAEKIQKKAVDKLQGLKWVYEEDLSEEQLELLNKLWAEAEKEMLAEDDAQVWIAWETKKNNTLYSNMEMVAYKFLAKVGALENTEEITNF